MKISATFRTNEMFGTLFYHLTFDSETGRCVSTSTFRSLWGKTVNCEGTLDVNHDGCTLLEVLGHHNKAGRLLSVEVIDAE